MEKQKRFGTRIGKNLSTKQTSILVDKFKEGAKSLCIHYIKEMPIETWEVINHHKEYKTVLSDEDYCEYYILNRRTGEWLREDYRITIVGCSKPLQSQVISKKEIIDRLNNLKIAIKVSINFLEKSKPNFELDLDPIKIKY
jgi:hypothetical protein